MPNGKEITSFALNTLRVLLVAGILGLVGMAGTQLVLSNRIEAAEDTQKENQPIIDSVDVLKAAVEDIEEDIEKIDKKIDRQHKETLDAIKEIR